jgi:hypothetical protein
MPGGAIAKLHSLVASNSGLAVVHDRARQFAVCCGDSGLLETGAPCRRS